MKTISSLLKFCLLSISFFGFVACSNDARRYGYENFIYKNQDLLANKSLLYDGQHYQKPYFENAQSKELEYQPISYKSQSIEDEIQNLYKIIQKEEQDSLITASLKSQNYQKNAVTFEKHKIIVKDGDTLYNIAQNNGYTIQKLAEENNIQAPYKINVGQELILTKKIEQLYYKPDNQESNRPLFHKVGDGDNLFRISVKYNVKMSKLAEYNNIDDASSIYVGQKISIPPSQEYSNIQAKPKTSIVKKSSVTPLNKQTHQLKIDNKRNAKMRWPVSGRIIKHFSLSEKDKNEGINILAPYGTGVRASDDGEVVYADDKLRGYGKLILIRHNNQIVTAYAYNSKLLVEKSDTVKRGQVIAHIGSSGAVNRPQLHFEVRKGSLAVDPLLYLAKK